MYERRRVMLSKKKVISPLYIYEEGYTKFENVLQISYTNTKMPTLYWYDDSVRIVRNSSEVHETGGQSLLLKVDFTYYNKLTIEWQTSKVDTGPYLGYSLNGKDFIERVEGSISGPKTTEFNISGLKGEYYIKLQPGAGSDYGLSIMMIKLEM